MKVGVAIRTMGPQATRETVVDCARAAERAGLDEIWLPDHVAIPPDDAEGSEGRYLDVLATLAFLAAATERIGLGTGVLVLPYRPTLATAKWIATIQELSGNRLRLGVGVGWMPAEFRAVGVPRARRGQRSDETLAFLHRCFANDEVESNGQPFLFRPRPPRPPIYVGGAAPHALERAVRFGEGWMPMGGDPARLRGEIAQLRDLSSRAGKPSPEVVLMTGFPREHGEQLADWLRSLHAAGVTRLAFGGRYRDASEFGERVAQLAERVRPAAAALGPDGGAGSR